MRDLIDTSRLFLSLFLLVPCTRNRFFSSTYTNGRLYVRRLANLSNGASRIQFFVSGSFFLISFLFAGACSWGVRSRTERVGRRIASTVTNGSPTWLVTIL